MTTPRAGSPKPNDSTPLLSLNCEDLRLGMYIHLHCSWFRHPFSRQQFLLTSESQIATIRGLGLSSILVDPAQSTPDSLRHISQTSPASCDRSASDAADRSIRSPGQLRAHTPATAANIRPAGQSPAGYQDALKEAAQAYEQAAQHFTQSVSDLHAGSEEGVATAKAVTIKLAHLLLDDALAGTIVSLLDSWNVEERDVLHALNVSVLAMMIGQQFDLSLEDIKILGIGALLHDIGIHGLRHDLRVRHEELAPEKLGSYREHPALGVTILSALPSFPHEALRIVESHHERIDGSGYPDRLKEEYLSLFTKIVMVADEYDILINNESRRHRMIPAEALSHLYRTSRTTLPPEVIDALVQTLTVYPPGTIVQLVNGAFALVLNINRQARMKPLVLLYTSPTPATRPIIIDLMKDRRRAIARRPPLNELPAGVRDYLDMHRWTAYFLGNGVDQGVLPDAV